MKKGILVAVIVLFFVSNALAHSGRTYACDGHHDRKHGGYHIHNFVKYCTCYPDAQECITNKDKGKGKDSDTGLTTEKDTK
jgi:hypothetical protein